MDLQCTEILAIVDDAEALEEITRLAVTMKRSTSIEEKHGSYHINIIKSEIADDLQLSGAESGQTVLVISSNVLGKGEDHLGGILMTGFIYSLAQMEGVLKSVIFINSGVFLTTEGSGVLGHLKNMEERGIEILSSSTCLTYYHLLDRLMVGTADNMFTITARIIEARRLITF